MRNEVTTIITGTYNKYQFLPDAAASVLNQTDPNWRWWLVLDEPDERTRDVAEEIARLDTRITLFEEHPPTDNRNPYLYNREAHIRDIYMARVATKWLSWLSDDDTIEPCFVEVLTKKLKEVDGHVAFGACEVIIWEQGQWKHKEWHAPGNDLGGETCVSPFTVIDGGQFLQSKESHDSLKGWTFFGKEPSLIDGFYMQELAKKYRFYRVPCTVYTKRITHLSTYQKGEIQ